MDKAIVRREFQLDSESTREIEFLTVTKLAEGADPVNDEGWLIELFGQLKYWSVFDATDGECVEIFTVKVEEHDEFDKQLANVQVNLNSPEWRKVWGKLSWV